MHVLYGKKNWKKQLGAYDVTDHRTSSSILLLLLRAFLFCFWLAFLFTPTDYDLFQIIEERKLIPTIIIY